MDTTDTTDRTVWQLARLADVADPDAWNSPGARFLVTLERAHDDAYDDQEPAELADSCVPVYTHERWLAFVDLAAYNEDLSEHGATEDLTEAAGAALYLIGERLLCALRDVPTSDEASGC